MNQHRDGTARLTAGVPGPPGAGLQVADVLSFPPDVITETLLILAKRGAGKTHTASVLVEEMIGAGLPVCVIDPVGVWWGLRSSADGTGPGLPVTILGGDHADLPLPAESGAAAADLVVDERLPVVLDLSRLSKTAQRRFVTDFLERLYHRNREPLHVVVDEADLFAPMRGGKDTMRLLGAYEDLVRRGRARGLGCTSITQRPASLHTDIRSQAEVLIALRLIGTHDVAAIDEWVRLHATDEEARELKASLPSLPVGTAWVWSPGWLESLVKVQVRRRRTFDSSATPKVGQQVITPREFAAVNPADLERMAARLQTGAAPGESQDEEAGLLRAQVRQLRAALADAQARQPERVEVPVLTGADRSALENAAATLADISGKISAALRQPAAAPLPAPRPPAAPAVPAPPRAPAALAEGAPQIKAGAMRMLTALARQHPLKVTRSQLATLGGVKKSGGTFSSYFSALRTGGLITEDNGLVSITGAGMQAAGVEPGVPVTAAEIREQWRATLKAGARTMLDHLLAAHPASVSRTELAQAAGLEQNGGTFGSYLSSLRSNGLAEVNGSQVRAADVFFLAAAPTGPSTP
jgi:hypothetical protein